ncbi:chromosome partition protein Smc [Marmoricola endophyticus]|uniref:Chromosome partition protein Smc n=1 Tax=Marmoricola endophyticus TaxID=2040280 RepID=A0A917BHB9_9ACTN|nr:chromosome segregation protein SMC [Marmoricola endophyticus]GGF39111.1 chromosome partition protein Smc [Marmoricola endophyticus]
MYLKTLTMRGFKSFASATTLQLEPGITCIVGPNGSGKSNVVDALAWVMGEQGVKSLRGGKMEDVIFAGTSGRSPLGRAEVQLTIDNADGALPIEYAEVTISRTMFRNGGSEYAINGQGCRLLDVQELLSDSGIGREMHVIVGQGQLDSILHATPEDRRGFIEEAAGVLKHRKRKEKALRKLDATEANLHRLADLTTEIRRQLKPLGRQAEVARRAAVVQADARDARARLLADDLAGAREALEQEVADHSVLVERKAEVEQLITQAREQESALEAALREDLPQLARAQETWFALSGLRERVRGTEGLARERVRSAVENSAQSAAAMGEGRRDPDRLDAEAEEVAGQEHAIRAEVEAGQEALGGAERARGEAESSYTAEEQRVAGLQRAAADRREGLARLHGQVNGLRNRAAAAEDEVGRLGTARDAAQERAEQAQRDFTALETQITGLDEGEEGLDAEHEQATEQLASVEAQQTDVRARLTDAERERAALEARHDALQVGLNRKDGAGALLAASDTVSGMLGSVAALLSVRAGYEVAVAAALGDAADAVAVRDAESAVGAIRRLKDEDLGRAGILLGGPGAPAPDDRDWPGLPGTATYAVDLVECPADVEADLRPALARMLFKIAVVQDLDEARALVAASSDVTAVTVDGDVLGAHYASGGSTSAPSLIEVQAAVEEASQKLATSAHTVERLSFETQSLDQQRLDAEHRVQVALSKLHESDATLAAVAERLGQHGSAARSAHAEADRLAAQMRAAEEARESAVSGLADLEQRLAQAEDAPEEEPDTTHREELAQAAREARQKEMDARLALRTAEERGRALQGRAEALRRQATEERESREREVRRRERLGRQAEVGRAVAAAAEQVLVRLELSVEAAAAERQSVEAGRSGRERDLREVRDRLRALAKELDELTGSQHRDEMARAQQRMRIEQLEERALAELGLDPAGLVADYGPDQPVPVVLAEGDLEEGQEPPPPAPYDRDEQQARLQKAERALAQLGRINPLALEEFSALEDRHKFITEQLEDLRGTRRDLLDIVREVDARVQQVFTEAYADVTKAFDATFARLFPGGEGRLVLTDPDDMLASGVEVEARPAGKKVKRLSLLSGGERSLVAVAFLVALFKARPSPFYILDEVEAALDDTNLGRLLEIYEELRESSQLLVITHQKRTMEVGDALYGVTMRGDGVSAVISQRLREE